MNHSAPTVRADGEQRQRAIIEALSDRVGPQKFNAWFKASTRLEVEDDHVHLAVPNPFVASWIENHFRTDLEESVREGLGERRPLMISVDASLSKLFRKRQLDTQANQVAKASSGRTRTRPQDRCQPLRHRLEDFVVGPSNQLAFSAAVSVAGGDRTNFNPLFIHGGCGLGKTHLLQGICNAATARNNGQAVRWRYVSGEQFTNEFISAIKSKGLEQFRQRYRKLDLLVVDDVHFLAAKKATQEEFLHTFDTIDAAGKQVVMASDAHPKLVGQLTEQLTSRFVSGIVVRIDPPDRNTRLKLLRRRAQTMNVPVCEEVLQYIAAHIRGSVRELEGALLKLAAYSSLCDGPVTLDTATEALADHLAQADSTVTLGDIESIVSAYFGVTPADIHSSRRTKTVSLARSVAMMLARRHTTMSFPEIARFMGKNHSSVVLAVQRMEKKLADSEMCDWMTPAGPRKVPAGTILETLQAQLP